ncbi:Uncharacterised protein [Streptococcus pneumoniae]|nr:Uncharacterised protein [Streptococcus pneumoniae]
MDKINYFSAEEAILLHDIEVIEKIGGLHGVKDKEGYLVYLNTYRMTITIQTLKQNLQC